MRDCCNPQCCPKRSGPRAPLLQAFSSENSVADPRRHHPRHPNCTRRVGRARTAQQPLLPPVVYVRGQPWRCSRQAAPAVESNKAPWAEAASPERTCKKQQRLLVGRSPPTRSITKPDSNTSSCWGRCSLGSNANAGRGMVAPLAETVAAARPPQPLYINECIKSAGRRRVFARDVRSRSRGR